MKYLKDYIKEGVITLGRGQIISKDDMNEKPGNYPVYSSSASGNGVFGHYGCYMFDDERITWSIDGGGKMFYRYPHKYSVTNVCGWLKVNNITKFSTKYLYYSMLHQWKYLEFNYTLKAHPSVIQDIYHFTEIPLEEQQLIVAKLDAIHKLINKEKQSILLYDELIKSRFIELFGDPIENPKQWETITLKECTNKIGSGATPKGGKETYRINGISLIRSMNVYNTYFEYKDLAHISDDQAQQLNNVIVHDNDVLLNITGASVARCCLVPKDILPARVNQHVCIIRCVDKVVPTFLCRQLTTDQFQQYLWAIAGGGATREAITKQQIEKLSIIAPPLALQNSFAAFVAEIDKLKFISQKKIQYLEELLSKQMDTYFG